MISQYNKLRERSGDVAQKIRKMQKLENNTRTGVGIQENK